MKRNPKDMTPEIQKSVINIKRTPPVRKLFSVISYDNLMPPSTWLLAQQFPVC